MALFKILKGQASNLGKESIRNGYCYVTLDDHKMYIDHVDTDNDGKEISNSGTRFCLNAEVADRLSTARTITLSGDASGSVNFDGSQDINLVVDIEELDNIKEAIEVLETKKPDLEEVNEQIQNLNNKFEEYLPLTAGPDKKINGPLGLTAEIMYGPDLPLEENSFEGQLFFLEDDGVAIPLGGVAGQVLAKNSDKDGDVIWVDADNGVSLPSGGITGQVLIKNSNEDGDAVWADIDTITVDLDNTNIGSPNSINADSLGGRPATDYATENYVLSKIAEAQLGGGDNGNIDLSGYATKEDLKDFITEIPSEYVTNSELASYATKEDLKDFITEIPSEYVTDSELTSYAKKSEIPDTSAFQTAEQVASLISEVRYSPILNLTTVANILSADMLGKTVMCRTAGEDFTLTITKEIHDTLPIGFEVALVFWDTANSVKLAFTGGVYACIAGEGSIENATLALPDRFTMVAAKKVTSKSWLVTGNVEVV